MAIDTLIEYECAPRRALGVEGILERLKAGQRAAAIIRLYRRNDDMRSPREMGFEMLRVAADGSEETQLVIVQHLLDSAAELREHEAHCAACPANARGVPFGCYGHIGYPLSAPAESWLLARLPQPSDAPLVWLLLKQAMRHSDGGRARSLRAESERIFAARQAPRRALGELPVDGDQVFELLFLPARLPGEIRPAQAAMLLLFFDALGARGEFEAREIMRLGELPPAERARLEFRAGEEPAAEDESTAEMRAFLRALHLAWRLDARLLLDV